MDSRAVKHSMTTKGIIGELIPSFRSGSGHRDDRMRDTAILTHAPAPTQWELGGVQMMMMPYLLATMVDLS